MRRTRYTPPPEHDVVSQENMWYFLDVRGPTIIVDMEVFHCMRPVNTCIVVHTLLVKSASQSSCGDDDNEDAPLLIFCKIHQMLRLLFDGA